MFYPKPDNKNAEIIKRVEQIEKLENVVLENDLNEVNIKSDHLEDSAINLDENKFFRVYEMINNKIKDNLVEHLRNIFIEKKIKKEVDLTEMVDDEDI